MGAESWVRRIPPVLFACRLAYRSLRPREEVLATVCGRKMYLDPSDTGVSAPLITFGTFEPAMSALFGSLLARGYVVVDIGANIGFYTLLAADIVGEHGKVIAFEPVPRNVELLRKSVEVNGYKNVTVVPKALSNRHGETRFLVNDQNRATGRIAIEGDDDSSIQVEITTLDEYFGQHGTVVDLMKIDAEGAEPAILEGARALLARSPDLIILTEYNPKLIRAFGRQPTAYLRELSSLGFELLCLSEDQERERRLSPDGIDQFTESLSAQPENSNFVNFLCLRGQSAAAWWAELPVNQEDH